MLSRVKSSSNLIQVYPRKRGWPDLLHSNSNLSNSHSPSRSIQGILLLQTNTLALLLHLHLRLPPLESPLASSKTRFLMFLFNKYLLRLGLVYVETTFWFLLWVWNWADEATNYYCYRRKLFIFFVQILRLWSTFLEETVGAKSCWGRWRV